MKGLRDEKGSVTVFVLVMMMLFLGVLVMVYSGVRNKNNAQLKEINEIQNQYTSTNIDKVYDDIIENQ